MPEEQQPEPQPQLNSQKTNWKKIGLTVVIIIVVTGLIAGVYWFFVLNKSSDTSDLTGPVPTVDIPVATESATPSAEKDETADWKTYEGKMPKYSIKYPSNWFLDQRAKWFLVDNWDINKTYKDLEEGSGFPKGYIKIAVICEQGPFFPNVTTAKELYDNLEENRSTSKTYDIHGEVTKYNLNGLKAKKGEHGVTESAEVIWVLKDPYLCEIRVTPSTRFEEKVVKSILSTFKFLD